MDTIEFLEEHSKSLHIPGARCNILSPVEWIKRVRGLEHLRYLDEEGVALTMTTQLMEWYGEYVGRKVKECCT